MTPEEIEKEAALKAVKEAAEKAAQDKLPELLKAGLSSEDAKVAIKAIVDEAFKSATIKDIDGTEKTINVIVEAMQKQHDDLAIMVKSFKQGKQSEKGSIVEFVEKNIADNPGKFDANKDSGIAANRNYSAKTTIKAAALMTTANVLPNVAGGFSPLFGNYIDNEIGHIPKPEMIMLDLVTVKNQPGTESIWYSDRINEDGDAEFIGEGTLKPLIDADYQTAKAPIKEVAERWKMTKRLMNHAPAVIGDFTEHAYELIEQKFDSAVLGGDGLSNNLTGITTAAGAFTVPAALAEYYESANIYDVINAMASAINIANFNGQLTAVLNTVWKAKMMGIKDSEGRYIVPPFVSPDGSVVAGVNVRFSNKIGADEILIGELRRFNVVFAENIEYDEGYENDDFSKNLISRKLEAFLGTYIKASAAGSILFDNISAVLTDIAVPVV